MVSLNGLNTRGLKKGIISKSKKSVISFDPEPPLAAGKGRLYSNRFCPWAERVLFYAAAKGIQVEIINIDPLSKPEWYFSKHPQGKVPAFEKDGKVVIESAVIPEYLDALYPDSAILPTDPYLRAKQRMPLELASEITTTFHFLVLIYSGQLKGAEKDQKLKEVEDSLDETEKVLEADYFGGTTPGYADWMLFPVIKRVALFSTLLSLSTSFPSSRWPSLSSWFERMSAHPVVKAVVQPDDVYFAFAKAHRAGKPDYDIGI